MIRAQEGNIRVRIKTVDFLSCKFLIVSSVGQVRETFCFILLLCASSETGIAGFLRSLSSVTCRPKEYVTDSKRWVLFEQLVVSQLRKKFQVFYGTHRWSLFWARWIQSTASYPIYLRSILISSSYLKLVLPVNNSCTLFFSQMSATFPAFLIFLSLTILITFVFMQVYS
jgi:hypothetical protein